MRFIFKIWGILLCGTLAFGQTIPPLYFKHLDPQNGLSDPDVRSLAVDHLGFVWIGTFNGLNRFDGINSMIFQGNLVDSLNLEGDAVFSILNTRDGNLWLGTQKGLSYYDYAKGTFKNYRFKEINNGNYYYASPFFADSKGRLWTNMAGGVFLIDSAAHTITYETSGKSFVNERWKDDVPWILTPASINGIYIHYLDNEKVLRSRKYLENIATINDVYIASDTLAWLASDKGLISLNPHSGRYAVYPLGYSLNSVVPYKNLLLLGSNGGGLIIFDINTYKIVAQFKHLYSNPASISGNSVDKILIDANDNLFVSVVGKGIDYAFFGKPVFDHFLDQETSATTGLGNHISAILQLPSGEVWCGSGQSGIAVYSPDFKKLKITHFADEGVNHLIPVKNKGVLVELKDFSYKFYSFDTRRFSPVILNGLSTGISSFTSDPVSGQILISTPQGSAYLDSDLKVSFLKSLNSTTEWKNHFHFTFTGPDEALVQTFYTNLYLVRRDKNDFKIIKEIARTPYNINASLKKGNKIYLATTSGLFVYDIDNHKLSETAVIVAFCTAIAEDKNGLIWINTHKGIYSYHPGKKDVHRYYNSNGLQGAVFNANTLLNLGDGRMITGGNNGVNCFNPDSLDDKNYITRAFITRVLINDIPYSEQNPITLKKLKLDYKSNTVTFRISPLDFRDGSSRKIGYRMVGYDAEPLESSGSFEVRYARMPPGKYRFEVYIDGKQASEPVEVEIIAPFWQKIWFLALITLFLIGLSLFLVILFGKQVRKRQLEKLRIMLSSQEDERKRIAVDLHDDLGGRLSSLKLFMQAAVRGLTEDQKGKLKDTTRMLDDTIAELRNILFNLSPKSLDENGLEAALKELADNIERITPLNVETSTDTQNITIGRQVQYAVYRICQELINNTLKHASASKILISLVYRDDGLVFLYEDDGVGFEPDSIKSGYGLTNIKTHAQAIFSDLTIDSSKGKGTAITLIVPPDVLNSETETTFKL